MFSDAIKKQIVEYNLCKLMKKNKVEWFKPALLTLQSYFVCIFTAGYTFPNLIAVFLLKQLRIRFTRSVERNKMFHKTKMNAQPSLGFDFLSCPGSRSNRAVLVTRDGENWISHWDIFSLGVLGTAE